MKTEQRTLEGASEETSNMANTFHNFVLVFGFLFHWDVCLFNSEESKINMTFERNQKRKHGVPYHVDTKAYFNAVLTKKYGSAMYKVGRSRQ